MICPKCGAPNPEGASFCQQCGGPLPAAAPPQRAFAYAGFWRRFAASLIDGLILGAAFVALSVALEVASIAIDLATGSSLSSSARPDVPFALQLCSALVVYGLAAAIAWLYYASFESSARQATPGKMALGIIVTDMEGNRISFAKASGRFWGKIVSAIILYVGFVVAGLTEKKQALHDMMAGCLVIRK